MLQVINTEKFNLAMDINVDYEAEKIEVRISFTDYTKHDRYTYSYPASEFSAALAKFEELKSIYED